MLLLDIASWWQGMDQFEKILWVIALLFSAMFLFQAVFSIFSGDGIDDPGAIGDSDDFVGGDDGVGHQYFTIKNLIAFFTMFSWVGIASYNSGLSKGIAVLLGMGAGIAMVIVMVVLLRNVNKLRHSGAGNNAKDAVLLLISDKLPELVKMQTEAIKNIKIDKVTVWENGQNGEGKNSTANFVSGLYKAVPPLKDIFDMAGMDLPAYLGKPKNDGEKAEN